MRYVGLDSHWRQSTICVLEEVGKIRKPFAVCFEASTGYGHLFESLQIVARRVVAADAYKESGSGICGLPKSGAQAPGK